MFTARRNSSDVLLDGIRRPVAEPIAVAMRALIVGIILALTAVDLAAQESILIIFNDGTQIQVPAAEVRGRVLVLHTREGRRQLMPRALVDEAATSRANPGLFTRSSASDPGLQPARPPSDDRRMPTPPGVQPAMVAAPEPVARSAEHGEIVEHVGDMGHGASRLSAAPIPLALERPRRPLL